MCDSLLESGIVEAMGDQRGTKKAGQWRENGYAEPLDSQKVGRSLLYVGLPPCKHIMNIHRKNEDIAEQQTKQDCGQS